jgi:hypothetical protein
MKRLILSVVLATAPVSAAYSQDSPFRKELKRADLTDTNMKPTGMEVILSTTEIKPGEVSMLHIHHGEEAFYDIEGATIELPDGKQVPFPTGMAGINARDMPHGALKVVGDKPLKLVTVHIVDKGKPLYDHPK